MSTIELTRQQSRELYRGDLEDFTEHEEGDWDVDHKYQHITNIVLQQSTGKFFEHNVSRSGSPFTDWYYDFEDQGTTLHEVKQVVKTIVQTTWETV
ncbi:hypothetical protein [Pseudomonas sp.]|uniref:hypothetical protein n=1 Tax=Pseudomonas sp. TaxID=306 RepID=UPI003FD83482